MAIFFNNNSDTLIRSAPLALDYPFSISVWFWAPSLTSNYGCLFSETDDTATGNGWRLDLENTRVRAVAKAGGAASSSNSGGPTFSTAKWHHAAGIWVNATERYSALDGVLGAVQATSRFPVSGGATRIGHQFNGTSSVGNVGLKLALMGIWNADMRSALQDLANGVHPLDIASQNLRACLELDGAQDFTGGAWTLTSSGANAGRGHPGPTGLVYQGQRRRTLANWNLTSNKVLSAASAAYVITSPAAELKVARRLTATAAAFAIMPAAASLEFGAKLAATPPAVVIAAADATLRRGARLDAQPASFAISGIAASLERGYRLNAAAAAFAITAQDATLNYSGSTPILNAQPGAFAITAAAASLEYGRRLVAEAGAVSVAGSAVSLKQGRRLDAQPAAAAITAASAQLLVGRRVPAAAAAIVIDAATAAFVRSRVLSAGAAAFEITGGVANLLALAPRPFSVELVGSPGGLSIIGAPTGAIITGDPGS